MDVISKNYKPEILVCPKCETKLNYLYASSARTITFSLGKKRYVKNLAYICPTCKHVYLSQTATKFAFKGMKYSTKTCYIIYYYKKLSYSREQICDMLSMNNVFISDRNIDLIYKRMCKYINTDYTNILKDEYNKTISEFNDLKLSIDLISYNKKRLIIIRNFYTNNIIGFYEFKNIEDENISLILRNYINKDLPISTIFTIRKDDIFVPLLKNLAPNNTRFISFLKI